MMEIYNKNALIELDKNNLFFILEKMLTTFFRKIILHQPILHLVKSEAFFLFTRRKYLKN